MPLEPGSSLGPYLLQEEIGAGGMGVVYRALDPKLDREVAVKVLPPSVGEDPVRVARFEREAKAVAALSHPNVLGIFDFGCQDGIYYAVMELLQGETLRDRLRGGALPARRAVELATQIALGLGAAHLRGIVHRDIKPENIFICRDGQVKVLDFGLAKAMPKWTPAGGVLDEALTLAPETITRPRAGAVPEAETRAGILVGTVGYMSPEQVRGEELDARSDIFSFGSVLYEMLTGQRAFRRDSHGKTMEAILQEEPAGFRSAREPLAPVLESIVSHCLEKRPEARFQSMRDIAFALQHLETATQGALQAPLAPAGRRPWPVILGAAAVLLGVLGLLAWMPSGVLPWSRPAPALAFHHLPAPEGTLESAFFGPDGRTVYYAARVQGRAPELFALRPGGAGPESLGLRDAVLLGVSTEGELALLRHPVRRFAGRYAGTLAQAPSSGGSFKDVLEDVCDAAWDGRSMALLVLEEGGRLRLEFPSGRVALREDGGSVGIKCLRLAPGGDRLAYIHCDSNTGHASVETLDRAGRRRILFEKVGDSLAQTLTGLAWGPRGVLWFTEWEGDQTSLWSLSAGGRKRLLWRGEGAKQILDASAAGEALMATQRVRRGVFLQRDGATQEISVLGGTQAAGLSADGRALLLLESPALDGGTDRDQAYIYRTAEEGPVKLARGNPLSLTPDGRNLNLALDFLSPRDLDSGATAAFRMAGIDPGAYLDPAKEGEALLFFLPTGPGRPKVMLLPRRFQGHGTAYLLGEEVIFQGQVEGKLAWYRWTPGHGEPEAITPEGLGAVVAGLTPLSPGGDHLVATGNGREWFIVPVRGQGKPQPIRGLQEGERVVGWCADGRRLFIRSGLGTLPVVLSRLDPETGVRTPVSVFSAPDPAGHLQIRSIFVTPDARTLAYTYDRKLSELFRVDGLS